RGDGPLGLLVEFERRLRLRKPPRLGLLGVGLVGALQHLVARRLAGDDLPLVVVDGGPQSDEPGEVVSGHRQPDLVLKVPGDTVRVAHCRRSPRGRAGQFSSPIRAAGSIWEMESSVRSVRSSNRTQNLSAPYSLNRNPCTVPNFSV